MDGLFKYFCSKLDIDMQSRPKQYGDQMKDFYLKVFDYIIEAIDLKDPNKPFKTSGGDDMDLTNPYGKAACIILYLYSLEPPFYAVMNQAIKNRDRKMIKYFGPFACAFYYVTTKAEIYREDRQIPGNILNENGKLLSF